MTENIVSLTRFLYLKKNRIVKDKNVDYIRNTSPKCAEVVLILIIHMAANSCPFFSSEGFSH